MDLASIIRSKANDVKRKASLVKGKKWVKRGVVNKIAEEQDYKERRRKREEQEARAKRKAEERALAKAAKRARRQLDSVNRKLGTGTGTGNGASPVTSPRSPSGSSNGNTSATTKPSTTSTTNTTTAEDVAEGGSKVILPVEEVIRRLRSMGAPITLFGESDMERLKRMRKIEIEGLDDEGVLHTGTHAMRNVFLKGKAHQEGENEVDDLAEFDDDTGASIDQDQLGRLGEAGVTMTSDEANLHAKKEKKRKKQTKSDHVGMRTEQSDEFIFDPSYKKSSGKLPL